MATKKKKETDQQLADRLGKNKQLMEFFGQLHDRWQDEKEYEDIADYATAMRKNFQKELGATAVEARKKPSFIILFHFGPRVAIIQQVKRNVIVYVTGGGV